MRITVLSGGVGGARFLLGVRAWAAALSPEAEVTAIVNTADDLTLHGLRVCPDLDSVMYTLGGGIDDERGWGRRAETWTVAAELADYGSAPDWFSLGDRDFATHIVRSHMLAAGYGLAAVTRALCARWQPGITILPMTEAQVETHVVVSGGAPPGGPPPDGTAQAGPDGRRAIHFQEWWVRHHAKPAVEQFVTMGAADAEPGPGVSTAISTADLILLAPSNPVVSIGTILAVPGIASALAGAPGPVVGVSPVISGAPVRGMAEKCLPVLGVEVSARGVAEHYGVRGRSSPTAPWDAGLLDGWLVDTSDADARIEGLRVSAAPLLMTDIAATTAMVDQAVDLARSVRAECR